MKNKLLVILLLFSTIGLYAQISSKGKYVVLTFERSYGSGNKNKEVFYWMTSVEKSAKVKVVPLYANMFDEPFASEVLVDCIKGDTIEYWKSGELDDSNYTLEMKKFTKVVKTNRVFVQEIVRKWNSRNNIVKYGRKVMRMRNNEYIKVYATPIVGVFCNCVELASNDLAGNSEFVHRIYMPVSNFEYLENFWSTPKGKLIKYADYSTLEFDKYVPIFVTHKNKQNVMEE